MVCHRSHTVFFVKYMNILSQKALGFVALAYFQDKAIAGNVYFHFGQKAVYKYGASDKTWQHLRASNLAMWEAIKWYCRNGYKELHFGRTEPEHQGLRQFKMGWGAKEYSIKYFKYDINGEVFFDEQSQSPGFYPKLFSLMPGCLLRIIGSVAYKHVG